MTQPELTGPQAAVLAFVNRYRAIHQMPPTRVEIAAEFKWASPNAAEEVLRALERKGAIRLIRRQSRGIFVL